MKAAALFTFLGAVVSAHGLDTHLKEIENLLSAVEADLGHSRRDLMDHTYRSVGSDNLERLATVLAERWPAVRPHFAEIAPTEIKQLSFVTAAAALAPAQYVELAETVSDTFINGIVTNKVLHKLFIPGPNNKETLFCDNPENPAVRAMLVKLINSPKTEKRMKAFFETILHGEPLARHRREWSDRPWDVPPIVQLNPDGTNVIDQTPYPSEAIWRVKHALAGVFEEAESKPGIIGTTLISELRSFDPLGKALNADWEKIKKKIFPDVATSEDEQHMVVSAICMLPLEKYLDFATIAVDAYQCHRLNHIILTYYIDGRERYFEKHRDEQNIKPLVQLMSRALDGEAVLKHRLQFGSD